MVKPVTSVELNSNFKCSSKRVYFVVKEHHTFPFFTVNKRHLNLNLKKFPLAFSRFKGASIIEGASIHFLDFVGGVNYEGAFNVEWAFIIAFTVFTL